MPDIGTELEAYDEHWKGIEVQDAPEFGGLPDGRYQVEVDQARVEHSQRSGRPQLTLIFKVISGEYAGRYTGKFTGLDTDMGREIAKNDLHRLGLDIDKLSGLPQVTPMLIGVTAEIGLQTKPGKDGNEYQNTYINKLIEVDAGNYIEPPPVDDGAPW